MMFGFQIFISVLIVLLGAAVFVLGWALGKHAQPWHSLYLPAGLLVAYGCAGLRPLLGVRTRARRARIAELDAREFSGV